MQRLILFGVHQGLVLGTYLFKIYWIDFFFAFTWFMSTGVWSCRLCFVWLTIEYVRAKMKTWVYVKRQCDNLSSLIYAKSACEARRVEVFYDCWVTITVVFAKKLQS